MRWHIENERHFKKGINNNLSLCNYSISEGEISYSLLNYRYDIFTPALLVILPFKAYTDVRGIIRMAATFRTIRDESRWFKRNGDEIIGDEIIGDEKIYIISMLQNRIIDGFSWSSSLYNYKIRRYRLNAILSSPNLIIDRNIDIHHNSGLKSILEGTDDSITDDRYSNLMMMDKQDHYYYHHHENGDTSFIDYRKL
jgi:hypothetical protein